MLDPPRSSWILSSKSILPTMSTPPGTAARASRRGSRPPPIPSPLPSIRLFFGSTIHRSKFCARAEPFTTGVLGSLCFSTTARRTRESGYQQGRSIGRERERERQETRDKRAIRGQKQRARIFRCERVLQDNGRERAKRGKRATAGWRICSCVVAQIPQMA